MSEARADLHVHTKYSDRPSEWILRRIGSPESFTEPIDVYKRCIERGMNFVTISDHNRIDGALAISHLPGTFISAEMTTYFPEDGAKMHCLVTGVTEAQFATINKLRENIYDFRDYLVREDIVYSLAHPLFRVNDRVGPDHIEKLLLLFNRFELINGTRDPRASEMVEAIFANVTPDLIERLVDKHGIQPIGLTPWDKCFTGGSDDHGGVYIASANTVTPEAHTVEEYLQFLREGNHTPGGHGGTSVRLAHSFYHIAYSYYRKRLFNSSGNASLIGELFQRLLERPEPQPARLTIRDRAKKVVRKLVTRRRLNRMNPVERNLVDEFAQLLRSVNHAPGADPKELSLTGEETFELASNITHQLSCSFLTNFIDKARQGNLIESLQMFASLGPVALSISPYLAAMATQHKDEKFIQAVAERFDAGRHLLSRSGKRAWLTDTFVDVNGVSHTIRQMAAEAKQKGVELQVITSVANAPQVSFPYKNFAPIGQFKLAEYENQMVSLPPFLDMIEYLESQRFSEVVISTPGPVGLTALAAGRLLGLRMVGIYHTDFPMYVRHLTNDDALGHLTQRFMLWFYDQMDIVFAPSTHYREQLIDAGLSPTKVKIMRRGVDTDRFSPAHRNAAFWERFGLERATTLVYVGRVSEEKNVERLLQDFARLRETHHDVQLAVVGDGPQLAELERRYRRLDVTFTGALRGDDLAAAYASADAFVFPSTTDTFGNVVLEAMASGLPAIVSDRGGPQEIVVDGHTGIVVNMDSRDGLLDAMKLLCSNTRERHQMGVDARRAASAARWSEVFDQFWTVLEPAEDHEDAASEQAPAMTFDNVGRRPARSQDERASQRATTTGV